jgi:hypothetical protein
MTDLLTPLWGGYVLAGTSHDINCAFPPNQVVAIGHNITSALTSADGTDPAWMFTLESRYHPGCGTNWLQEAHIQWRSADGSKSLRPFSVSVNPVAETAAVMLSGDLHFHGIQGGDPMMQLTSGTVWTRAAVTRIGADQPILSCWISTGPNTGAVEVARVKEDRTLVLGNNASAIRLGSGPAPTIADFDELLDWLVSKGMVVDGRT